MTKDRDTQPLSGGALAARLPLIGLLLVQIFPRLRVVHVGGTKVVRGGFPGGLADEFAEKSEGTAGRYKSFLDGSIIPNAEAFGYLIEIGEQDNGA